MDVASIASTTVALLTPYLTAKFIQTGEKVIDKANDVAWDKAQEIFQAIKQRFAKEDDTYYQGTLNGFESKPDKRKESFESALKELLESDQAFASTLSGLVQEAEAVDAKTVFNTTIQNSTVGEVINVETLGTLTINKESSESKKKDETDWVALTAIDPHLVQLQQKLLSAFNESDLQDVSFKLGIDHENLSAPTKVDLARELILACYRQDRISELIELCRKLRPKRAW